MYRSTLLKGGAKSVLQREWAAREIKLKMQYDLMKDCKDLPHGEEIQCFYLIVLQARTCLAQEFLDTYGEDAKKLQNLIKRAFGSLTEVCDYGVLFDQSLRVVYVFNQLFAYYNELDKEIVFKSPDEVLAEAWDRQLPPQSVRGFKPSPGVNGLPSIRYIEADKIMPDSDLGGCSEGGLPPIENMVTPMFDSAFTVETPVPNEESGLENIPPLFPNPNENDTSKFLMFDHTFGLAEQKPNHESGLGNLPPLSDFDSKGLATDENNSGLGNPPPLSDFDSGGPRQT